MLPPFGSSSRVEQWSTSLALITLLALAACRAPAPAPAPPPARTDPPNTCIPATPELDAPAWAMLGGKPGGQRRSDAQGPELPGVRWIHELEHGQFWGIAIGGDGTAHVAANDGAYAIDRAGRQLWFQRTGPQPRTTPALAPGGLTYIQLSSDKPINYGNFDLSKGNLSAYDRCGELAWRFPARPANIRSAVVGHDGTVFIAARPSGPDGPEALFALNPEGARVWSYPTPRNDTFTTPPIVDQEGNLYLGTLEGRLLALSPKGKLRWTLRTKGQPFQLALSDTGRIYVAKLRSVEAVDSDGKQLWQVPVFGNRIPTLAVAGDSQLYVSTGAGLVAVSADGIKLWEFRATGLPSAPVVDAADTLYVAFNSRDVSQIYAIDAKGEQKWLFYTEGVNAMAMGADGTLYVATNHRLYALAECLSESCPDDGSALTATNRAASAPTKRTAREAAKPLPKPPPKPTPPQHEPHEGYDIYPNCRPGTTAIVRTEGNDFPWYANEPGDGPAKQTIARTKFRGRASAAVRLSSHATGFGVSCVEPRGAFVVYVYPGQDVATAARAVGEWLKKENLRGEIDIVVSEMPTLQR